LENEIGSQNAIMLVYDNACQIFKKKITLGDPQPPLSGHPGARTLAHNYVDLGMVLWVFEVPEIDITMLKYEKSDLSSD
jgi:hypothetical protein